MPVIAHLSDPHLNTSQARLDHLRAVLRECAALPVLDAVVMTGDLADHGDPEEYAQLFAALPQDLPTLVLAGNHDLTGPLQAALSDHGAAPDLNAALQLPGIHVIGLDSHLDGNDEGVLDEHALDYARDQLAQGEEPVVLAMHHPPVPVGHSLMDRFGLQNPADLAALVEGSDRVIGIFTGHVHTALAATFAGVPLAGAPGIVSTMRLGSRTDPVSDATATPGLAVHTIEGRSIRTARIVESSSSALVSDGVPPPQPQRPVSLGLIALTLLPFVVTSGTSFTIIVGAAVDGDRRASLRVWAGTALGIALIAVVAAFRSVGDYVAGSQTARTVFGVLSGAVLIGLAAGAGLRARTVLTDGITEARPQQRLVLWAFLALITNVKALSLYGVVLPTAIDPGSGSAAGYAWAAAVNIAVLLAWLTLVGTLVPRTPALRSSARARAALFAAAALALAALGLRSIIDVL